MLVGAFSSNAYGYPRATKDADIVIEYEEGVLKKICESLGSDFKLDPQTGFELMTGSIRNILTFTPTKFELPDWNGLTSNNGPTNTARPNF